MYAWELMNGDWVDGVQVEATHMTTYGSVNITFENGTSMTVPRDTYFDTAKEGC